MVSSNGRGGVVSDRHGSISDRCGLIRDQGGFVSDRGLNQLSDYGSPSHVSFCPDLGLSEADAILRVVRR